jgi:hypothetical protein
MSGPLLSRPLRRLHLAFAVALGAAASSCAGPAAAALSQAQARPDLLLQAQTQAGAGSSAAARSPALKTTSSASKPNNKAVTKPLWSDLTPAQQEALAPLGATWNTVSEVQKRKWLALSENYPRMSTAEQDKLHSRMSEWAALSPHQRTQARLNFAETQQLAPGDKRAKWEAYQKLSPEEKRKLAASAEKPPPTAAAVKPVAPEKLAAVPRPRRGASASRIAVAADPAEQNPVQMQSAPASAPATAQ